MSELRANDGSPLRAAGASPLRARGAGPRDLEEEVFDYFKFRALRATVELFENTTGPSGPYNLVDSVEASQVVFCKQGVKELLRVWTKDSLLWYETRPPDPEHLIPFSNQSLQGSQGMFTQFISQTGFSGVSEDDEFGTSFKDNSGHNWQWMADQPTGQPSLYNNNQSDTSTFGQDHPFFRGPYPPEIDVAGSVLTLVGPPSGEDAMFIPGGTPGVTLHPSPIGFGVLITTGNIFFQKFSLFAVVLLDELLIDVVAGRRYRTVITPEMDVEINT